MTKSLFQSGPYFEISNWKQWLNSNNNKWIKQIQRFKKHKPCAEKCVKKQNKSLRTSVEKGPNLFISPCKLKRNYSSQQSCIVIEVKKQEELEIWSPFKTSITEKSEAHPNCPTEKWNAKIWWFSHPQSILKIGYLKSGHHHHCCPPVRMKAGAFGRWGHKNVK